MTLFLEQLDKMVEGFFNLSYIDDGGSHSLPEQVEVSAKMKDFFSVSYVGGGEPKPLFEEE